MFDQPLKQYALIYRELTTRTHEQLIERRQWERSVLFNEFFRPCGIDDRMLSGCRLPPDEAGRPRKYQNITVYRALGGRPFSSRDRRIIRLLHRELRPLIGRQLASAEEPSASQLSPRLRQVLGCLLEGDSEKQIAGRLGLTPSTVHQYVKAVYRHFGVHSRAELLVRWIRVRSGSA